MRSDLRGHVGAIALMVATAVWATGGHVITQERLPRFELDAFWAKIPEKWVIGAIGGLCIDEQDYVFVTNRHRPRAQPAGPEIQAPGVIEFNQQGEVVNSWNDASEFGDSPYDCRIDASGDVWFIAAQAGVVRKVAHDGAKVLLQIAARFAGPVGLDLDPRNGDVYVADGAGGHGRIAVFDRSGQSLRQWPIHGADANTSAQTGVRCVRVARDGLVYVCDGRGHRIQVFDTSGQFKKNVDLPTRDYSTAAGGDRIAIPNSPVAIAFSPDAGQRYMYVVDEAAMQVEVVDRQAGTPLSSIGRGIGGFPGQFRKPHGIAVDSKGNVYVGEEEGQRFQRFKPIEP